MIRPNVRAFWRYRPRLLTLALLLVVATPIALGNFTSEVETVGVQYPIEPGSIYAKGTYGWPFTWHWHNLTLSMIGPVIVGWDYSGARLAANLASWMIFLALPVGACEWWLRCYRPRLRWSLRTMLAAVALVAGCCGLFAALRNRASLQDPIIAELEEHNGTVYVERQGPRWFEFVIPDRYRRSIVAFDMKAHQDHVVDETFVCGLGRLPRLKWLTLHVERLTPGMADSLQNARGLRCLSICEEKDSESEQERRQRSREFFTEIGKLTQLEALGLKFPTLTEDSLTFLRGLTSLKVLSIEDLSHVDGVFSHLPRLPNLEAIDLTFPTINGRDLRRLSVLPRLKALDMKYAEIGSDADLKDLAQLESLEDLVISGDHVSPEVLESLSALQHLRSLHITPRHSSFFKETDRQATFVLDRHATLSVLESEAEGFRRALGRLRRRNPGINIDNNESSLRRYFGYFHGYVPDESYEGSALESAWLPERLQYSRSPGSAAPRAANGGQGVF